MTLLDGGATLRGHSGAPARQSGPNPWINQIPADRGLGRSVAPPRSARGGARGPRRDALERSELLDRAHLQVGEQVARHAREAAAGPELEQDRAAHLDEALEARRPGD